MGIKQRERRKNALTLVGLELVTPCQEARVFTIRPPVPPSSTAIIIFQQFSRKFGTVIVDRWESSVFNKSCQKVIGIVFVFYLQLPHVKHRCSEYGTIATIIATRI